MLRRKPTRIELKLEDMDEWHAYKKEKEQEKKSQSMASSDSPIHGASTTDSANLAKSRRELVHERIGYNPRPLNQQSRVSIH